MSTNEIMDTNGSGRRRREWSETLKREIVAATLEPGASVSVVARRYDVNANQVFTWRKLCRAGLLGSSGAALMPVTVAEEVSPATARPAVSDVIEIEVPGGYRVRVGAGVDGKALRCVLDALARRGVGRSLGEG